MLEGASGIRESHSTNMPTQATSTAKALRYINIWYRNNNTYVSIIAKYSA